MLTVIIIQTRWLKKLFTLIFHPKSEFSSLKSLAQACTSKSSNKLFSSPTVRNLSNFLNPLSLLFYHSCMFAGPYCFPSPSPPLSFPLPLSCLLTVILFQNATHMVFYSIVNKQAIVSIRVLRENFWLKNLKIKHAMR